MSNIPTRPVANPSLGSLHCLCHLSSQLHLTSRGEAEQIFQLQCDFFFFFPIMILFSVLDFSHMPLDPLRREGEYVVASSERSEADK